MARLRVSHYSAEVDRLVQEVHRGAIWAICGASEVLRLCTESEALAQDEGGGAGGRAAGGAGETPGDQQGTRNLLFPFGSHFLLGRRLASHVWLQAGSKAQPVISIFGRHVWLGPSQLHPMLTLARA